MENKKPGVGFGVMLFKGNEILLGRRHKDPAKADSELHGEGTWTMPGGKLEFKEEFNAGAYRETLEETGIVIDPNSLEHISTMNNIVEDAHFVTLGFLCKKFTGEAEVKEPDEITEWKWFDLNNLPSPIFFPSKQIIEKFLERKA